MVPRRNMRAYLFLTILAATSAFSLSSAPQVKGRKLFGGYRIVPKVCQPTNPSRIISDAPAICMFNYECTRRNGEVVGACMDGFLFGACCQLPAEQSVGETYEASLHSEANKHVYEVDHVPDLPILLNPDGTPMGIMRPQSSGSGESTVIDGYGVNEPKLPTLSDVLGGGGSMNTKISTFDPLTPTSHYVNTNSNSEKQKIPQVDLSHLEADFPALLNQQSILDDLQLPGLITHSDSNNDIQDHQDAENVDTVTTFLNPDQVLQIADPVDQLPVLFTQGLGKNNHSSADTIVLNENGGQLTESNNPDDLFIPVPKPDTVHFQGSNTRLPDPIAMEQIEQVTHKVEALSQKISTTSGLGSSLNLSTAHDAATKKTSPVTEISTDTQDATSITYELYSLPVRTPRPTVPTIDDTASTVSSSSWKASSRYPVEELEVTYVNELTPDKSTKYISPQENGATTPMSLTTNVKQDELIRVPTITYDTQSGNKKHDVLDHEENSINHIISLLNNSNPTPEPEPFPEPNPHPDPHDANSGIQTWASIDGASVDPPKLKFPTTIPSTTADPSAITFPYTFYTPNQYFSYDPTQSTEVSDKTYAPIVSTQGSYDGSSSVQNMYSSRPSTNPPAPTVIVLGPLGTEYITKVDMKPPRRPTTTVGPSHSKKPAFSTTITHNINTVISTGNVDTNNTRVVSSSYISVDLQDGTTTSTKPVVANTETTLKPVAVIETLRPIIYEELPTKRPIDDNTYKVEFNKGKPPGWSEKPTFQLKPSYVESSAGSVIWPHESQVASEHPIIFKDQIYVDNGAGATPVSPEEETTAPDDFNNFPPVRNPNLNMSVPSSQQEKPTIVETFNNTYYPDFQIIDENEIPTPAFIENEVLVNKVDGFVDKIVESLQVNFDDLNEVIYKKRNSTSPSHTPSTTAKSPTQSTFTTRKPIRKPAVSSTTSPNKKPNSTNRPPIRVPTTTQKIEIASNKPSRPPVKTSTAKPKPAAQATTTPYVPQTVTKRPKPVRKPTVPTTISTQGEPTERPVVSSTDLTSTNQKPNYKRDCGVRPMVKTGRIVGGKGAKFGEWPWQVLVREATWLGLFTKNKCGGVLITNKYVVTAAHCQPGFLASLVAVLGEFDITGELESKRSVSRNIRRVIVHRNYDPATFENDLALLEMETPIQFDTHIVPICMPEDNADFTGRMATVTGWGRLKYNGGVPSTLQEVQVPIMENSVCQEMFQTTAHTKKILDSFLCAGYANGQKDSCEGDSGGPLVLQRPDGRWELAGTVSHGIKCAAPYLPGVYMRTTYFKPWLHSVTGV